MQCNGIMRCVFAWNKSSTHHNKQDMARAIEKRNFEMYHRVKFQSIIRGHHVYKSTLFVQIVCETNNCGTNVCELVLEKIVICGTNVCEFKIILSN